MQEIFSIYEIADASWFVGFLVLVLIERKKS